MKTPLSAANSEHLNSAISKHCRRLETDATHGLSAEEAERRLSHFGYNEITIKDRFVYLKTFLRQFQSAVVLLLLVAQAVSFVAGEFLQAGAILFALMVNAFIGFVTEIKARISIKSLEDLMKPSTRVIRNGSEETLQARLLVPGDIVLISAGDSVPADLKLIEAADLRLDQSALSGESTSVFKSVKATEDEMDEVFHGTIVQTGRGRGIVFATGLNTKIGRLGKLLLEVGPNQTPLERNLDLMGADLSKLIVVSCIFLFIVGVFHDESPWTMVQVCIALAVAAIPEGMPVIATLALAAGTKKMARKGALVKTLPAVETLGCTGIICSDKTGTLTENQMMVSDIVTYKCQIKLEGKGYEPDGLLFDLNLPVSQKDFMHSSAFQILIKAAGLCNDATLENHEGSVSWHIHGDPTEGALLTAAAKTGLDLGELNQQYKRISELPFSLDRKMMSTAHTSPEDKLILFSKGSPEAIFKRCQKFELNQSSNKFTEEIKNWFASRNHDLASEGLRVLAFAYKKYDSVEDFKNDQEKEKDLIFLGLAAMSDQIRPNVEKAIESCQDAGIKVIMITGDQARTARAIASKLNLKDEGVLSGKEIMQMADSELKLALEHSHVLARTTPEIKLRVVKLLQEAGHVVAMTGDGVNDAPALRQADVGVAMGKNGTHLAREACDLVLTDDNFATIVHAIQEGRIIYTNIRKSVAYLLTASFSCVLVVSFNVLFHCGFYLNPIQLLWLNLIMHIFPGLALALERTDSGIMKLPPRPKNEPLLSRTTFKQILLRSLLTATIVAIATHQLQHTMPDKNLSFGFALLSFLLLAQAWSWIYFREDGFCLPKRMPRKTTLIYMAISYIFLLVALYVPGLNSILSLQAIEGQWITAIFLTALAGAILIDGIIILIQLFKSKKCLPCE